MANEKKYTRESQYTFQEINKSDDMTIMGKVVRTYNKRTENLNESSKKMEECTVKEAVSIMFYYDIVREMITFCERQSFGYNQFMEAFGGLLNACVEMHTFEIFLQKDGNILDEKLSKLKTVTKIKATLIPPNSNEEDLDELRQELEYMTQCEDARVKKVKMDYESDNIKMDSKIVSDIKKAVSYGYGDITACGMNYNDHLQTISSSQDAAYTSFIMDDLNFLMYKQEAKSLISRYIMNKIEEKNKRNLK